MSDSHGFTPLVQLLHMPEHGCSNMHSLDRSVNSSRSPNESRAIGTAPSTVRKPASTMRSRMSRISPKKRRGGRAGRSAMWNGSMTSWKMHMRRGDTRREMTIAMTGDTPNRGVLVVVLLVLVVSVGSRKPYNHAQVVVVALCPLYEGRYYVMGHMTAWVDRPHNTILS